MIGYLKGNVLSYDAESVLLECSGVGYEVICSGSALSQLSGKREGELYTYLSVREDGIVLFGFSSKEEKNLFLKLITVTGVGPKMAIQILSAMNMKSIATAIATADVKMLSSVRGLGKKTAERIILELKDKLGIISLDATVGGGDLFSVPFEMVQNLDSLEQEAVEALMGLAFTRAESIKAVKKAKSEGAKTVEDIIMYALRSM